MEPAAALVVPRPEKKMVGGGESDFREAAHVEVSVETMGDRLEDVSGGARRPRAYVLGLAG